MGENHLKLSRNWLIYTVKVSCRSCWVNVWVKVYLIPNLLFLSCHGIPIPSNFCGHQLWILYFFHLLAAGNLGLFQRNWWSDPSCYWFPSISKICSMKWVPKNYGLLYLTPSAQLPYCSQKSIYPNSPASSHAWSSSPQPRVITILFDF